MNRSLALVVAIVGTLLGLAALILPLSLSRAGDPEDPKNKTNIPILHDSNLKEELVAQGLKNPTSMRFIDNDTILVLEKNRGQVRLVDTAVNSSYSLKKQAVLTLNDTAKGAEQGMLGIAVIRGHNDTKVLLYFTQNETGSARNRIYEYDYDGHFQTLENGTMVLDLPGEPGPFHNGGKITIGPDGYLYAVIGDLTSGGGLLDNQINGRPLNDRGVIIRVDRNSGEPAADNPFYSYTGTPFEKLSKYYAYGIRNSFGIDFDPLTGKLWMTEDGPDNYDEINVVEPGFNSGWHAITGPLSRNNATITDLVSFNGSKYSDPVFSWYRTVGVTDLAFFNSTKLGTRYENNIFVGDINYGNLYFFKINEKRTGLALDPYPGLADRVADPIGNDTLGEARPLIIGENFGRITDIETGPDGYLYVLTYYDGKIWRISSQ